MAQRGDCEVAASLHVRPGDVPSDQLFLVQLPPMVPEPNHKVSLETMMQTMSQEHKRDSEVLQESGILKGAM